MNTVLSNTVSNLIKRGLTDTAVGTILGAYISKADTATLQDKQSALTSIMFIKMLEEKKQQNQITELVGLLGLTMQQADQAANAAATLIEEANNGQTNADS